jgi:methylmalonyl-CoA mutase cobalamin-binding domain/chain
MRRSARVVLVAPGLDQGAAAVARALRDAGTEVIALGDLPDLAVVETALQEDADAVGILGAGTDARRSRVIGLLHDRGLTHVVVLGGSDFASDPAAAVTQALGDRGARLAG